MIKSKKILLTIILFIFFLFLLIFYKKDSNTQSEILYLYSSSESGSLLTKTDNNNKLLKQELIPDKHLILGAFMNNLQIINDKIYCASPLNYINNQGSISRIDTRNLSVNSIDPGLNATAFVVSDNIIYASASTPEFSTITKTNIETGELLSTYQVPESIYYLFIVNKQLYYIANNYSKPNSSSIVYSINSQDHSVSKCFELTNSSFIEDVLITKDFIFFASYNNIQDHDAFEIFKYNISTKDVTKILLPFSKIHKLHLKDNKLYAVQYDYRKEPTQNFIAVIDIFTNNILQVISLPTVSTDSAILNDTLITSDGISIYKYSLNDFELKDSFNIPNANINDFNFVGFAINTSN